jgi:endonuclease/exonuclease/phosphatase family metal-dependent hydrolase
MTSIKWLSVLLVFVVTTCLAQTRVMTYNIRNSRAADGVNAWNKRKDKLANLVKKVNPDILGTQEVIYNQLKDLNTRLKEYTSFGVGRNNGKHKGEHSVIFFKTAKYKQLDGGNFWLSETPTVPGSKSWDAALTRICTWVKLEDKATGKIFFVFNTHFDHKGIVAHNHSAEMIRHTVDSITADYPVIVIGDFNSTPKDLAYQTMTQTSGYRVNLSDSYTAGTADYTDCGFNVSNTHCNRIDYIFFSKHYTKSNYTLYTDNNGTYYPSDHLTISVDLN